MHFGWPSPFLGILETGNYTIQITKRESTFMAVTPMIGEAFGSVINAIIIDRIGRKFTIFLSSIPIIMAWLCIGLTSSTIIMLTGRFIVGISNGLSCNAVPIYLGEIASPKVRGLLTSLFPVSAVLGIFLIFIFGAFLSLNTASLVSLPVPVLFIFTFLFMPESPYFHLMKGNEKMAVESLKALRGQEDVTDEFNRIYTAAKEQKRESGNFLDLFAVDSNRRGLFIILGMFFQVTCIL